MGRVAILGIFNADLAFRAARLPRLGETILGESFALGPGGKGSNQAVAAARLGAEVDLLTRLGEDAFAELALGAWAEAGVTPHVRRSAGRHTGAAFIFVDAASGDNAIIVAAGAGAEISAADMEAEAETIRAAAVFLAQLEQPVEAALRGLEIAREAGVATVLNPAPAADLPAGMLALCDHLIPNQREAEALTGIAVAGPADAARAARALRGRGVGTVIVTLGARGAWIEGPEGGEHVSALSAGPVAETTGAGDAFCGAFAAGLAEGMATGEAVRFACAAAAVSVTRPGAAAAMPTRAEVEALLARG